VVATLGPEVQAHPELRAFTVSDWNRCDPRPRTLVSKGHEQLLSEVVHELARQEVLDQYEALAPQPRQGLSMVYGHGA
jgi:hypothetical protein